MPPHAVLQSLLQANRILNERPAEAIKYLAQHHGVDLAQLAQAPVDPVEQIQARLASKSSRRGRRNGKLFYAQQQAAQQQQQAGIPATTD